MPAWRMISTASSALRAFTSSRLRRSSSAKILPSEHSIHQIFVVTNFVQLLQPVYSLRLYVASSEGAVLVHSRTPMKLSRRTANILLAIGVYMLLTWGTRVFTFLSDRTYAV